jgi:hypothetical protein
MDSIHLGMRPEEQSFTASATASLSTAPELSAQTPVTAPLFRLRSAA